MVTGIFRIIFKFTTFDYINLFKLTQELTLTVAMSLPTPASVCDLGIYIHSSTFSLLTYIRIMNVPVHVYVMFMIAQCKHIFLLLLLLD